ncbi:ATPase domain-containing protein [Chloroflexus sp.]|uniref:ATPase domain-containing protein n=1 Tax=Chloroflexus sp. TaxID=1904827 RepID=UPI00298F024D|nr:ATPase domain-containing protein [Chloroflexus sp.]MCS6887136.1 recombinase RecA [Chloroflexus sp.]MDW8403236.1 ATPase domain-containing protein [Chloroflexus sp.]
MNEAMANRLTTGIPGLDEILGGGLVPQYAYLVRGGPGAGKTTLGLHFLATGAARGETALFISLEEAESKIRRNAARVGIDLSKVHILDLSPSSDFFAKTEIYDIFSPAEVEREPLTRQIVETVQRLRPSRVFFDPITQFRYLTPDVFQFRKQVISFLRFLAEQQTTVIFSAENSPAFPDDDLQYVADGIITLELTQSGRYLSVSKMRGSSFISGRHAMRLTDNGLQVFPRIIPSPLIAGHAFTPIPSGVPELDELLNGGIERGTITLITGPSGVGKTTLGFQFMKEAASRGERSIVFSFEEEVEIMLQRCEAVNIPVRAMQAQRLLRVEKIEPLQYNPDEFAQYVRHCVEQDQIKVIMIDSVTGYRLCMQGEDLISQLHALSKYLQSRGITVILIMDTNSIVGDFQVTDIGASYLGDNIIFLRFLEIDGELRKAIGVLKKRLGDFEKALREFAISRYGIKVGKPLTNLRGILAGIPTWIDKP